MNNTLNQSLAQSAVISSCGRYRYLLTRRVGSSFQTATFIMLNPSAADATKDDPTIRRCVGFAQHWGCGNLIILNLFALRATTPSDMTGAKDPVGPENKEWFDQTLRGSLNGPVVCAWGIHGAHMDQDLTVLEWLDSRFKLMALGITSDGRPKHPLYVPYAANLVPFAGRESACWPNASG